MQHTLLNRFQATLLGAAIGEWGCSKENRQRQSFSLYRELTQGNAATHQLQRLTQFYAQQLLQPDLAEANHRLNLLQASVSPPEATGTAAIAFLAIVLFFHEDRLKLWQKLHQAATTWQISLDQPGLFAVGFAIAEALQERLNPQSLILQLVTTLKSLDDSPNSAIIPQLEQVQSLLERSAGLDTAQKQLLEHLPHTSTTSIMLAFYCFLSTPDDFSLSLRRAARLDSQTNVVCALTGALSGAYNSTYGIPVEWLLAIDAPNSASEQHSPILQLAQHLLAKWAGVYQSLAVSRQLGENAAIAAPQVIRRPES